jgi:hypothetical protein
LRDDELRARLGESLNRAPTPQPGDIDDVARRARRLRLRRRVLGSAVALGIAAALALPLALLLPLRGSDPAPSSEGSALPADVAEVVCEQSGPRVLTPVVRPQQDGVHVRVRNTFDEMASFGLRAVSGGGQGDGAPPGVSELVFPLAPGDLIATCSPGDADHGDPRWKAPLEVLDPVGLFVPYAVQCGTGRVMAQIMDYGPGAHGPLGDPVQVARGSIEGLESTDVIERAGYPSERDSTQEAIVRVVREGRVIVAVHYTSDGQGGWLEHKRETCEGVIR